MRRATLLLALSLVLAAVAILMLPRAAANAATTELKADERGHFVTAVDINGASITVLVDTGATAVALSYQDAKAAGLSPGSLDYNVPVATANGMAMAARVRIDKIVIDGIKVEDVEGLVAQDGALAGTLLGMSFLSRLDSFKVEDGILYLRN